MDELLNQIQKYIKAYKEPPYGREVEGTTEILKKVSQTLTKILEENKQLRKENRALRKQIKDLEAGIDERKANENWRMFPDEMGR